MNILCGLSLLMVMVSRIYGRAMPDDNEIVGVNVGGLHAGIKTNLFADDGPLAQLGSEISAGANELENELNSGAQALQTDMKDAENFLSQGSQEKIAGINIGGLHAELKTNLFSKNGPLALIGDDLAKGELQLENDLTKGADALGASLTDAAKAFQDDLASGANQLDNQFQNLGEEIASASGGLSLDGVLNGLWGPSNEETVKTNPSAISGSITAEANVQPEVANRELQSIIRVNLAKHGAPQQNQLNSNAVFNVQSSNSGQIPVGYAMTKTFSVNGKPSSNSLNLNMQLSGQGSASNQISTPSTTQATSNKKPSSGSLNTTATIQFSGKGSAQRQSPVSTHTRRIFLRSQSLNGNQNSNGISSTKTITINGQTLTLSPKVLQELFLQLPNICANVKGA